jgi:hypothetical protein
MVDGGGQKKTREMVKGGKGTYVCVPGERGGERVVLRSITQEHA